MHIPEFTLPRPLGWLATRLPATPAVFVLTQVLNQLVRRHVLPADRQLLAGKRFEVKILDAGFSLRFAANDQGFYVDHSREPADLCFSAKAADFARMVLREEDPDTLFFNRKLAIEGDTELGLIVKNLLDSVDWSGTLLGRALMA